MNLGCANCAASQSDRQFGKADHEKTGSARTIAKPEGAFDVKGRIKS
jgi:hypothetical protein